MPKKGTFHNCMLAKVADGFGTSIPTDKYDELVVQVATASTGGPPTAPTGTLECYGSASQVEPTWTDSASPSNIYAKKAMYDLDYPNGAVGDIALSASNIVKEYKINIGTMRFINFKLSGRSAGAFTVIIRGVEKNA